MPGYSPTVVALRTVSEAVARAACQLLEIEPGEIMAEFRPALTPGGKRGLEAEIFLYDTLPGGAGFSSQIAHRGLELIESALHLVRSCPEDCDASCYRCLRSFKNKFEHSILDRHVAADLLEYFLTGKHPQFSPARVRASTELLFNDVTRQSPESLKIGLEVSADSGSVIAPILVETKGRRKYIVALSGPLTPDHPADPAISTYYASGGTHPLIIVNELVVRGNLPAATGSVLSKLDT